MLPTSTTQEKNAEMGKDVDMCQLTEMPRCGGQNDGRIKAKHVWFGLMSLLVVIIMAVGIAVGAYFFHHAMRDVKEYHDVLRDDNGDRIDEDVESDVTNDVVTYHVRQPGKEGWVHHDFQRDIAVYKIILDGEATSACYASPLNDKLAQNPSAVRDSFNVGEEAEDTQQQPQYLMGVEKAIRNPSFLGKKITELCKGVDIYWSMPSCGAEDTEEEAKEEIVEVPVEKTVEQTDEDQGADPGTAVEQTDSNPRVKRGFFRRLRRAIRRVVRVVKKVVTVVRKIKKWICSYPCRYIRTRSGIVKICKKICGFKYI